jgi:hypothetical protein
MRWLARAGDSLLRHLLRRPFRPVIYLGLLGFVLAAVITVCRSWPALAYVNDEFAYLLGADTFAHGRVTNPAPSHWEHFESFHVLVQPTYASKYPPASALLIAIGQVLTGEPIVGVWLTVALMVAALTWMLQAWVGPKWALWGGLFALGFFLGNHTDGYWAWSYWGGSMPALGSALLFGGLGRLRFRPSVTGSFAMGLGLMTLAASRPFEGMLVALVPAGFILVRLVRQWLPARQLRPVFAGAMVLILGAGGMLWYNHRVTGSALEFPYTRYERTYGNQLFRGGTPPDLREYRHAEMRRVYAAEWEANHNQSFVKHLRTSVSNYRAFWLPASVLPLLLLLPLVPWRKGRWVPLVSMVPVGLAIPFVPWSIAHYLAPLAGPYLIVLTHAARWLGRSRAGPLKLGRGLAGFLLGWVTLSTVYLPYRLFDNRGTMVNRWEFRKYSLARQLESMGSKHLVIVEYGSRHNLGEEWVFNGADLDEAPVIWARSMGSVRDSALRVGFADRKAWLVQVEDKPSEVRLTAIPPL